MTLDLRSQLIAAATLFYERGWMMGTAGNLSARVASDRFVITASGCAKGKLTSKDFVDLRLNISTHAYHKIVNPTADTDLNPTELKPSAETSIHAVIYSLFPEAWACFHVHSVEANLVSNFVEHPTIVLPQIEMIKGLGVWDAAPTVNLPLFQNHADVSQISRDIYNRFSQEHPTISALLIRNHGVTVWANSVQSAINQVEIAEFIFRFMVRAREIRLF